MGVGRALRGRPGPAARRAYLDRVVARLFPARSQLAQEYGAALAQRNAALRRVQLGLSSRDALEPWTERLAALGQLTAGLAHELRNPLGSIRTSAELLRRNVPVENEIATEMAANIVDEVDRTNSLVTRFLDFAKPQSLRTKPTELGTFLDGVVARFRRSHPQATVITNYSPDVPLVSIDAEWMERVLDNLLTNAAQASPDGATITVKTQLADNGAEFAVIDRGSGIAPKDLESVFNPFFTTKPDGTGLGLAIVSKIVSEHGGRVAVESSPGEGTVVRVWLPC